MALPGPPPGKGDWESPGPGSESGISDFPSGAEDGTSLVISALPGLGRVESGIDTIDA